MGSKVRNETVMFFSPASWETRTAGNLAIGSLGIDDASKSAVVDLCQN
jgi:hypothetical protein